MQRAGRNEIYNAAIHRMVLEAMEAQEEAFAQEEDRKTLLALLKEAADRLGHSPWPREFPGGKTIEERFGTWEEALTQAGLPRPTHPDRLTDFSWYQEETQRQKAVNRQKRAEKKRKASQRLAEQKSKAKQKEKAREK